MSLEHPMLSRASISPCRAALLGLLAGAWSPACGGARSDDAPWSGAAGPGAGQAGSHATGGGGASGPTLDPDVSDGGDGFSACAADESTATAVGLDLYVVVDRSSSMADGEGVGAPGAPDPDCPIDLAELPASNSKWCLVTNALARFFTAATDRDVRVAIQFMTADDGADVCGADPGNPHATPQVGLTRLPVAAGDPLLQALDAERPTAFGTRIEGALNGIAMYTADTVGPPRQMAGVLITDGDPRECSEDLTVLARIASDHFANTRIPTFIIGMTGATSSSLEALAIAGGAPEHEAFCGSGYEACHHWSVGDGDPTAFGEVLEQVQGAATIACEYLLPGSRADLDHDLVQMLYQPAEGVEHELPRVSALEDCARAGEGWYYDDPEAPTAIVLCPTSCGLVSAAQVGGKVSVAYGCEAKVF